MSSYDATFKIVLLGDSASKTILLYRYLTNIYDESIHMTIGADFSMKALEIDGKRVKLQIWDFGGEERIRFLLPTYVRGAHGALFIYDIANYTSINNIDDWLSLIRKEDRAEIPTLLVGIMSDEKNKRQVSVEDGKEIAKSKNLNGFIECNIKTGENVEEAFEALTRLMMASKKNIKKKKNWAGYSFRHDFKLKKRSKRVDPKISIKPPLPPSPPPKPHGSPAMKLQGKESFPYPIFNSRFLNWSRGARWIRCPNCRKKFVKENYFTHSCTKKLNDIAVQSPKTPVRSKRDIIEGMMQNLTGRAQSEQKSNFKSDSLSDDISRPTPIAVVDSDSQLKGEVQSFLQWIKDSEGLSGYVNYYLQQNNTTIISELSKIYSELRQIFGV